LEQYVKLRDKCNNAQTGNKKLSELGSFVVDNQLRKDRLFINYIEHIQGMVSKTNKNRGDLLNLLDKVFVMQSKNDVEIRKIQEDFGKGTKGLVDTETNTAYSRNFQKYSMLNNFYINPNLTDETLQGIINETRVRIVRMYASCQEDFVKGVELLHELHTNVNLQVINVGETSKNKVEQLMASSALGGSDEIIARLEKISRSMADRYIRFKLEIKEIQQNTSISKYKQAAIRVSMNSVDRRINDNIGIWQNKEGNPDNGQELKRIIEIAQKEVKEVLEGSKDEKRRRDI